jgi:hypothetical protein
MLKVDMNRESGRMWEEALVLDFNLLCWLLPEDTGKNHEILNS